MADRPPQVGPTEATEIELAALRRFRDAIDAASVAYQCGWESIDLLNLERAVRRALKDCQDELDARDGAREG